MLHHRQLTPEISSPQKTNDADVVIIGAGPVGLDFARKLREKNKNIRIVMIERHKEYQRTQPLTVNVTLLNNKELEAELWGLVKTNVASKVDANNIDIPIQKLEEILVKYAKVDIVYKQFLTPHQFQEELRNHNAKTKEELEEKTHQQYIIGIEEINKTYPQAKIIIGADGAHSSLRDVVVDDEKHPIQKTDLRKLIELKYQVKGKVSRISSLKYYHAHTLLNGTLCTEHVKYDDKKKISEVTLRFIVDERIYNDPKLKNVNAKNLLKITDTNIPKELYEIINIWLNRRNDKYIIPGSATLNKTAIAIYSSAKLHHTINTMLLLLVGDAACGFPYMNGLNLGLESASSVTDLIAQNYDKITQGNKEAINQFFKEYDALIKKTFAKGEIRVKKADAKVASSRMTGKVLTQFAVSTKTPLSKILYPRHEIFDCHFMLDKALPSYIESLPTNSKEYLLSLNLLVALSNSEYDFEYIKALLVLAYKKNEALNKEKPNRNLFSSFNILEMLGLSWLSKKQENLTPEVIESLKLDGKTVNAIRNNNKFEIPEPPHHTKSIVPSTTLHEVIKHMSDRVDDYKKTYTDQIRQNLLSKIPKQEDSVNQPEEIILRQMGLTNH